MERRVLTAILLSFVVVFGYQLWLGPPPPEQIDTTNSTTSSVGPADTPPQASDAPATEAVVGETAERDTVIETPEVRAVFTNRGGRLKSWQLKHYRDHDGELVELVSTTLDSSHPLPLSLQASDPQITSTLNTALYTVTEGVEGGQGVTFEYRSSSGLASKKTFTVGQPYRVTVAAEVSQNNQTIPTSIVWGPGLGDKDAQSGRYAVKPEGIYSVAGKVSRLAASDVTSQSTYQQEFEYVGVDDHYFASFALQPGSTKVAFQPVAVPPPAGSSDPAHEYMGFTLDQARPGEPIAFYVGPKEFRTLQSVDRSLTRAINFGWFSVIVVPLLNALNWIYAHIVPNYGWAVAILTVFINLVLFPLNHKSVVSMRKMQEIQPEAKAIQERYSKLKATDPARQKMNQELMALYRERGVNPASGCVPILLTLPVFLAFYNMLQTAIELRGAPFVGWIADLSAADPYYVLPFLVGGSQLIQTMMTPQVGADPTQQKMMLIMPVVMSFLFISAPAGALIYWLVGNVFRIGQTLVTNRLIGPPNIRPARPVGDKKMKRVGSGKTEGAV